MQDQGPCIANVGKMAEHFRSLHDAPARFIAALHAKRENRATAIGQILLDKRLERTGGKTGVADPGHLRVLLQEFSDPLGVLAVTLHANVKCSDARDSQEGILWR